MAGNTDTTPTSSTTTPTSSDITTNDLRSVMSFISMFGNQLANIVTQFFAGTNFNPAQHGTIATLSYLGAQTSFAQMFGVDNPIHRQNAAKEISGLMYGYNNDLDAVAHQSRILDILKTYDSYIDNKDPRETVFKVDRMSRAAIAKYLVENGDLTETDFESLGQQDSVATKNMEAAEKSVKITEKLLQMGNNVVERMNIIKSVGGTNDFDRAADTYIDYISGLVQSGMSLAERQRTVTATLEMTTKLQNQGYSSVHAASIARNAVGGAFVGMLEARRNGIQNYDVVTAANNAAAIQAEAEQSEEGQSKLVAARTIMESDVLSDAEKQSLLSQVKSASPDEVLSLMRSNGLSDAYNAGRARAARDRSWLRDVTDTETQKAMEEMSNSVVRTYTDKEMDKYFQQNIQTIGVSQEDMDAASKVRRAMKTGDWSDVTNKVWDKASKYITKEGRDVIIAQRNAYESQQLDHIKSGMKHMERAVGDKVELKSGTIEDSLNASGLTKSEGMIIDTSKMTSEQKLKYFMEVHGMTDEKAAKQAMEDQENAIKNSKHKVKDLVVTGKHGAIQYDAFGNMTSVTDKDKYTKAQKEKEEKDWESNPITKLLKKIFDLFEKVVNNPNALKGFGS